MNARLASLQRLIEEGGAISDYPPNPYERVLVHFEAFTCICYMDELGVWRGRYDDQPITPRAIAWQPV